MIRAQPRREELDVFINPEFRRPSSDGLWVSDAEISFRQYNEFLEDEDSPERKLLTRKLTLRHPYEQKVIREEDDAGSVHITSLDQPVEQVHVEDAILYCNWLSHRDGLQACYTRLPELLYPDTYSQNMNIWVLDRHAEGYRLMTQPEWHILKRGRSETTFPFGQDDKWIEEFAVVSPPSGSGMIRKLSERCRSRLPNNYGLFDIFGNAPEWRHYPHLPEHTDSLKLEFHSSVFGKPFNQPADSKYEGTSANSLLRDTISFRVVRNVAPVSRE